VRREDWQQVWKLILCPPCGKILKRRVSAAIRCSERTRGDLYSLRDDCESNLICSPLALLFCFSLSTSVPFILVPVPILYRPPSSPSLRSRSLFKNGFAWTYVSYGPPWAHYLGGPLGLPDLRCTTPDGVKHKDYRGEVLG
jgi:hypothetical protein